MLKPLPWSAAFESAFLGAVVENHAIARGFHGIVRTGVLEEREVVTKEMFRDSDDEQLFTEAYLLGLLVPASPYLGYAVTSDGLPRMVSARMPETVAQSLKRNDGTYSERSQLAVGILSGRFGFSAPSSLPSSSLSVSLSLSVTWCKWVRPWLYHSA